LPRRRQLDDFITKPFEKEELAESRDPETGNHLERIQFYSKILTETSMSGQNPWPELKAPFVENIFLASPLHDIGKIGIPDFILLKPGRLECAAWSERLSCLIF
jgi:putative two-component system response regulator